MWAYNYRPYNTLPTVKQRQAHLRFEQSRLDPRRKSEKVLEKVAGGVHEVGDASELVEPRIAAAGVGMRSRIRELDMVVVEYHLFSVIHPLLRPLGPIALNSDHRTNQHARLLPPLSRARHHDTTVRPVGRCWGGARPDVNVRPVTAPPPNARRRKRRCRGIPT